MLNKYAIWRKWFEAPAQKQATTWLLKLNSNNLSQAEHEAFFLWLESSAENQVGYLKAERAWEAGEAIRSYDTAREERNTLSWWQWSAALSFCVLLILALFNIKGADVVNVETFELVSGYQEILLQDGTQVMLGDGAKGSFVLRNNTRSFTLESGRAYFNVMKDAYSPFVVKSSFGAVTVHGTKFSVELDDNNGVVTVLEGRVGVTSDRVQTEDILIANQQHTFLDQQQRVPVKSIDAKASLAWRKGKLVFKGDTLVSAVAQLERALNTVITLDGSVSNISIVGVVSLGSQQAAVSAIADIANLKWRKTASNEFVVYGE